MNEVVLSQQAVMQHAQSISIGSAYVSGIIQLVVSLLFIGSIRKTIKPVSSEHRVVSMWLVWFLLLPVLGTILYICQAGLVVVSIMNIAFLVFAWILIPFAVPNSLARHYAAHELPLRRAHALKQVGLWTIICLTVMTAASLSYMERAAVILQQLSAGGQLSVAESFSAGMPLIPLFSIAYVVLAIVYWCKIVSFRRIANHNNG